MYEIEPVFWLKFILLLAIVGLSIISFNAVMRKWLNVERKKFFSKNHINKKHSKIDWSIRISFIVILIVGYIINIVRESFESIWFLESWFIILVLVIVTEAVRAFMEWKYEENRNTYIVTISQLVFIAILLTVIFTTNLIDWIF